jgi:ABC-type Na+ transport system ATPase subunit NatA
MIRAENLQKSYGETRAVDGISFEVRQGEVYGLLGPNGAGKTTTLSMLAGLGGCWRPASCVSTSRNGRRQACPLFPTTVRVRSSL